MGGAALLGAIGMVGLAAVQGVSNFKDARDNNIIIRTCCEELEIQLQELRRQFDEKEEEQDIIGARQRALCNLVCISNIILLSIISSLKLFIMFCNKLRLLIL